MTKLWLCIDGVKTWLLCTVVPTATAGLVTFTLDFYSNGTLTIGPTGTWTAAPATGGSDQVFLLQGDFALITPVQPTGPNSQVFGYKTVPFVAP
jgi:hypothetical protein